ncbi:hypothetical protein K491DRAFT_232582 [Lophiostoma macrostomum CBS 122681]|uniref:Uncharacterized protein n=1 Tax=Lophiostoma macrostomum CBS 122681 TaxID=1314788 RepID=A0A6A6SLC8_9PLEO|nr:hypothetical protein K491DRAFT_232582 [Lophiostoma macrostomum CBS 122681]
MCCSSATISGRCFTATIVSCRDQRLLHDATNGLGNLPCSTLLSLIRGGRTVACAIRDPSTFPPLIYIVSGEYRVTLRT